MKKLAFLLILGLIIGNSEAQTVSKSGKTSTSHQTYSSSSNGTSRTTNATAHSSSSSSNRTSSHAEKQQQFNHNEPGATTTTYSSRKKITEIEANKTEAVGNDDNVNKGEIKKVERQPTYTSYEDRKKENNAVNNSTNVTTNTSGNAVTDSTQNTAPKYIPSNNSKIPLTCSEYQTYNSNKRREVLLNSNKYDFVDLNNCRGNLNFTTDYDDRLVITCEEFANYSDDKKQHIIDYPNFYNIDRLKGCESYEEFIKK